MSISSRIVAEPGGDDATLAPHESFDGCYAENRERMIPLRVCDLDRLLLGDPRLSASDRTVWSQLSTLVASIFHHEFHTRLRDLKDLYTPLDPDSDCVNLDGITRDGDEHSDEEFLELFESTLVRANYRRLDLETLKQAVTAPNEMGLNYVPDFSLFEHLRVYVRGDSKIPRVVRTLRTRFRKETVVYNGYQRLVVALKFRPVKHLDDYVRSDVLYLRMFKDVPHVDMEMHLPEQGTKVRMRLIDKAQIASPLAVGLPTMAIKLMGMSLFALSTLNLGALMLAPLSAGVNSFFGFQRAKQRHLHRMIRHLYYLTLANNASVINRLIDSAEEEETKEALLAYFMLWQGAQDSQPWDQARLDARVEAFLRERAGVEIDFEIGDALHKLHRLGLIQCGPDGQIAAVPIADALSTLDQQWDNYFRFPARR
jgi:hypothetical protein